MCKGRYTSQQKALHVNIDRYAAQAPNFCEKKHEKHVDLSSFLGLNK